MRKTVLLLLLLGTFLTTVAQEKFTISGVITDVESNETLIGVNVLFSELSNGISTNSYGFYSITLPAGTYQMRVSYLGYKDVVETITLDKNIRRNLALSLSLIHISEPTRPY